MSLRGQDPDRLPGHYWPIVAVTLLAVMAAGAVISVTADINPYTGALIAGGAFILRETWLVARRPRGP